MQGLLAPSVALVRSLRSKRMSSSSQSYLRLKRDPSSWGKVFETFPDQYVAVYFDGKTAKTG